MGWHLVITEEMRALGLSGNDLMVFALIHGFSQRGQGCYYGGIPYICEVCGIARRTAIYILNDLVERGLIIKEEIYRNGIKFCNYQVSAKVAQGVQKLHTGSAENAPNNKVDNINITLSNNKGDAFKIPTVEEVAQYCRERGNSIDAETFVAFYESNGWKVGQNKMKNWKAAVWTWEKRERRQRHNASSQPRRESVYEHNAREIDRMFGTSYHAQAYGNNLNDNIDEQ